MSQKVLVTDDHPPTVRVIQNALEREGFQVITASSGPECLLAVRDEKPDLLILDVIMPIMDGIQTLRVLRQNDDTKQLPVIILSIRGAQSDVLAGLLTGADFYLTKPFRVEEVVSAVRRMLSVPEG